MRLIDADWVAERLKEWRNWIAETYGENDDYVLCLDTVLMKLDDAPTADVEPVKHGHWIAHDMSIKDVPTEACSECGEWSYGYNEPYCQKCGAKMDLLYFNYPRWNGKSMMEVKKFFEEVEEDD